MPSVQPVPVPLNNFKYSYSMKFTLTDLSIEEINAVLLGLQELPAKICNPLTQKLRQQAESQLPQPETAATVQ